MNTERPNHKFNYPWKTEIRDRDEKLGERIINRVDALGIFDRYPHMRKIVNGLDPAIIGQTIYPFATGEKLENITWYLIIYFLYDDLMEEEGGAEQEIDKVINATIGDDINLENEERLVVRGIGQMGKSFQGMPRDYLDTLGATTREYIHSIEEEVAFLKELDVNGHPKIDDYITYRVPCSATKQVLDIVEYEMPETLPSKWRSHVLVERAKWSACLIMVYCNDYYSALSGRDFGRTNLSYAIERSFCIDNDEALKLIPSIHDAAVSHFVDICTNLEKEAGHNDVINTWILYVKNAISGAARWHDMVARYTSAENT